MRNIILLLLFSWFIMACSNHKATPATDDSEILGTDTVLTVVTHDELLESVPTTLEMEKVPHDSLIENYSVTKLDFGMIETFLVSDNDEPIRVWVGTPQDTIYRPGHAAIAHIIYNNPLSVDFLRITRSDLNAILELPDIKRFEITWIHYKEIISDTLVFSLSLDVPDTDEIFEFDCYHYNNQNRFEWKFLAMPEE